jgi:hypothetical protein
MRVSHGIAWSRRSPEEWSSNDYDWSDALFLAIVGGVFAVIAVLVVVAALVR